MIIQAKWYYYHIYNRGVNRQAIFFNDENWGYFMKRLRHYCTSELIEIIAYCLMPNHYHILAYLKDDSLSAKIMQPLSVSYTKAVNRQQSRVGPIFQGAFRAKLVDKTEYLPHLSRYLHLNPVGWACRGSCSVEVFYRDYIGLRKGTLPKPDLSYPIFLHVRLMPNSSGLFCDRWGAYRTSNARLRHQTVEIKFFLENLTANH